mmetsp:Transcript_4745/g.13648  ORF Transcript_4745/g.13648 Transcript_4745/m.13648 type:complete len:281 (+) Transcript_4745:867-1709(+)
MFFFLKTKPTTLTDCSFLTDRGVLPPPVDLVHRLDDISVQIDIEGLNVVLELVHGGGADDGAGGEPLRLAPRQRQLGRRHAVRLSQGHVLFDGLPCQRLVEPVHVAGEEVEAAVLGASVLLVFTAEAASCQGAVCQQTNVVVVGGAGLGKIGLEQHAGQQAVRVLNADRHGQTALLGRLHELGHAVRRLIGQPNVSHLASINYFLQSFQLLLKGHTVRPHLVDVVASGPEQGHVSVWPVDLQQVDVVCAQASQALVHRLLDLIAVHPSGAARLSHVRECI